MKFKVLVTCSHVTPVVRLLSTYNWPAAAHARSGRKRVVGPENSYTASSVVVATCSQYPTRFVKSIKFTPETAWHVTGDVAPQSARTLFR